MSKKITDFFHSRREDGTAQTQEAEAQSSSVSGENQTSSNSDAADQFSNPQPSSLEIDELYEGSSTSEESSGDEESQPTRSTTPKFIPMNLSKFYVRSRERVKKLKAEEIIEKFISNRGRKFRKNAKKRPRVAKTQQASKKRRVETDLQQQTLHSVFRQEGRCGNEGSDNGDQDMTTDNRQETAATQESLVTRSSTEWPTRSERENNEDADAEESQVNPISADTEHLQSQVSQNVTKANIEVPGEGDELVETEDESHLADGQEERHLNPRSTDTEHLPSHVSQNVTRADIEVPGEGDVLVETGDESHLADSVVREAKELKLLENVGQLISEHRSGFQIKLYVFSNQSQTEMYRVVDSIIEQGQMSDCFNISRNFIIFIYRDGDDGPEIFAMTSGQAYRYFEDRQCALFPRKIAKRLLQFKTIQLEIRNVTGETKQTKKSFLPHSGGIINIWDLIDAIVHTFRAYPKEESSVYNLECFQTEKGKKKTVSFSISSLSVTVNQSLTISNILEMVAHFSKIDKGKSTNLHKRKETEVDDTQFKQMEFVQEVHDKGMKEQLNRKLKDRINKLLGSSGENMDIALSTNDLEKWLKADKYILYLKRKQTPARTWEGKPPMLSDVIKAVKSAAKPKQVQKIKDINWLAENVRLATQKGLIQSKRSPITDFLVGEVFTFDSRPYFLWHGKWLKVKMEYHSIVGKNFKAILEEHRMKAKDVLPLPWVSSKKSDKDQNTKLWQTKEFELQTLNDFLQTVGADTEYTEDSVKVLLEEELGNVSDGKSGVKCTYNGRDYHMNDKDKTLALLFLLIHTNQDEEMYNAAYIVLDRILNMSNPNPKQQLGYIVGDKTLSHNIEMFDILMYSKTTTYLIHVKEGFDHHMRDVCSQIRNSADLLLRDLIGHSTDNILEETWRTFVKEDGGSRRSTEKGNKKGLKQYKRANQAKVSSMGKDDFLKLFQKNQIVYVLGSRDTRKGNKLFEQGDNITLKSSLQTLGRHFTKILQLLEEQDYVEKWTAEEYVFTDKFIIKIKTEEEFVSRMTEVVQQKQQSQSKKARRQQKINFSNTQRDSLPRTSGHEGSGDASFDDSGIRMSNSDSGHLDASEGPKPPPDGDDSINYDVQDQSADDDPSEIEDDEGNEDNDHSDDENDGMGSDTEETDMDTESDSGDESSDSEKKSERPKSGEEGTQIKDDYDYKQLTTKVFWEKVYRILKENMPKTNSTIAQLEILRLVNDFRSHQIGQMKFQLKISVLSKSEENIGKDLKTFSLYG